MTVKNSIIFLLLVAGFGFLFFVYLLDTKNFNKVNSEINHDENTNTQLDDSLDRKNLVEDTGKKLGNSSTSLEVPESIEDSSEKKEEIVKDERTVEEVVEEASRRSYRQSEIDLILGSKRKSE